MFNRSDILRSAWADYRRDAQRGWMQPAKGYNRKHFAYCLRMAWALAKHKAIPVVAKAPVAAKVIDAATAARVAVIDAELLSMQLSDAPIRWDHFNTLSAERAQLTA